MRLSKRRNDSTRFTRVGLTAGALAGTLLAGASSADAALFLDLRFPDGSTTMNASSLSTGSTVQVDLWARVIGTDANNANETFQFGFFGVRSSGQTAFLNADITARAHTSAFTDSNVLGQLGERSSPADNTQDFGSPTLSATTNWHRPRSGNSPATAGTVVAGESRPASSGGTGWEWRVGTATVTINSLAASLPASLTDALTLSAYLPTFTVPARAAWGEDVVTAGTTNRTNTGFTVGTSVSLQVQGSDVDPVSMISLGAPIAGSSNQADSTDANDDNQTVAGQVRVTGSGGAYTAEIDGLIADVNKGHAVVDSLASNPAGAPVYVGLWLQDNNGGGGETIPGLLADLEADGGATYDVLLPGSFPTGLDGLWPDASAVVRFNSFGPLAGGNVFNWDFAGHEDIVLDRVSMIPEPASLALMLGGALLVSVRRRKA